MNACEQECRESRQQAGALSRAEKTVTGIAEAREDVSLLVELTIERRAEDQDIGMCVGQTANTFGCGYEAEETDTRGAGTLEGSNGRNRTAPGGKHGVEQKKVALARITGHLEVVIHRLERVVVAVEANVSNARRRHEPTDALHHTESGPENRHQRELLSHHATSGGAFQRGFHRGRLERQIAGRFIGHQCRDLIDQFLEDLGGRGPVAEERQFVLDQGVIHHTQCRELGGGVHGAEGTIFADMKEYQAVIVRLTRHVRDDEDTLTDLLNERSRSGWEPAMISQEGERLTVVFQRPSDRET